MKPGSWIEAPKFEREGNRCRQVSGMNPPADPDGDGFHSQVLYVRVQFDGEVYSGARRCVGYFDGGEWKDSAGIKFYSYGGEVTHWYCPPELPR